MKVTGSTIQQLDKARPDGRPLPRSECRRWRLWATTEFGRKSKRFRGTYTQAQDALRDFVEELEGFVPNDATFASYAASWRSWRVQSGDYSPNTMASERTAIAALKRTDLAGMRMDEITPRDVREALLWLKSHPAKGSEYSASTIAKYRQVLRAVMQQAVSDGELSSNPVDSVAAPKVRAVEREALSPDELALFLNRLDSLQLDGRVMAVYLMATLGLRCGEACALSASNVTETSATVDATVRSADNSVGPPKSDSGKRTLPLPPRAAAKCAEWRDLRDRLGLHDAPTFCCNLKGGRLSTSMVEGWWAQHRPKLGCGDMTLHQLRHSNLSMMARHMSPFDLQRYAGWSSIAPAKIYVHGDSDAVERAVSAAWA